MKLITIEEYKKAKEVVAQYESQQKKLDSVTTFLESYQKEVNAKIGDVEEYAIEDILEKIRKSGKEPFNESTSLHVWSEKYLLDDNLIYKVIGYGGNIDISIFNNYLE